MALVGSINEVLDTVIRHLRSVSVGALLTVLLIVIGAWWCRATPLDHLRFLTEGESNRQQKEFLDFLTQTAHFLDRCTALSEERQLELMSSVLPRTVRNGGCLPAAIPFEGNDRRDILHWNHMDYDTIRAFHEFVGFHSRVERDNDKLRAAQDLLEDVYHGYKQIQKASDSTPGDQGALFSDGAERLKKAYKGTNGYPREIQLEVLRQLMYCEFRQQMLDQAKFWHKKARGVIPPGTHHYSDYIRTYFWIDLVSLLRWKREVGQELQSHAQMTCYMCAQVWINLTPVVLWQECRRRTPSEVMKRILTEPPRVCPETAEEALSALSKIERNADPRFMDAKLLQYGLLPDKSNDLKEGKEDLRARIKEALARDTRPSRQ